jgi:putative NADPH-quinone reductase
MKKILIINGHPNSDSYNFGLFVYSGASDPPIPMLLTP